MTMPSGRRVGGYKLEASSGERGRRLVPVQESCSSDQRELVNARLDAILVEAMLDFMYRPIYADSVPPLLALGPVERGHKHLDAVGNLGK